jgi:hypothetical protein
MNKTLLLVVLCFIAVQAKFGIPNTCVVNDNKYRLPRSIFPIGYVITLNPSLKTFNYTGKVVVGLRVNFKNPLKIRFYKTPLASFSTLKI